MPRGGNGGFRVLPRRVEQWQHAEQLPGTVAVRAGDAECAEPTRGEVVDRLLHGILDGSGVGGERQDHLGRALGDLEDGPVPTLHRRLGPLVDGVERLEVLNGVGLRRLVVLQAAEHGQVDDVVVFGARRQGAGEDDFGRFRVVDAERLAQRQLVLRERPGLVGA